MAHKSGAGAGAIRPQLEWAWGLWLRRWVWTRTIWARMSSGWTIPGGPGVVVVPIRRAVGGGSGGV